MTVYALVVVALYPSFKNETSLNQLTDNGNAVAALFGANGPLTTPTGWLNANLYANFVPLIALLLAIGYGASCLAGQDEDGTLALVATLPLTRRAIVAQKTATMSLQAVPVSLATMLCVLLGRGFDLPITAAGLVGHHRRDRAARDRLRRSGHARRRASPAAAARRWASPPPSPRPPT